MGLADRVSARVHEVRRADPVTLEEFGYLLGRDGGGGPTRAGVAVGPKRALAIPAWYSGCRYLAESVAFLPVHTFRGRSDARTRRADPPWLVQPDVETPWETLVEHWVMALLHRGNGYAWKIRNAAGQVTGLRPLHPDRVRVGTTPDGTKVFEIDREIPATRREVFHVPGLSYDGVLGIDVISQHAETLGRVAAADEYASRSFGSGSHLQAYLSVPQKLSDKEAAQLKAQWERFHRGMQNAHEFGVLGNGAEYRTISLTPEQQQLLETRKWGVIEVAQLLRVPPHKLYNLDRATFSNIEHQSIESVMDGIRPWVERIETHLAFDRDLLPLTNHVEFQLEGLLRGDTKTRYESYKLGIDAGWLSPAAAARLENQPAPDELDYYLRPLNMAVIRPGEPEPAEADEAKKLSVAEAVQKVYLGVGSVLTVDEARQIVNDAGGNLPVPAPELGGA